MKAEDFGINLENGWHDKRLTHAESCFVGILWEHEGSKDKISADDLAVQFAWRSGHDYVSKGYPKNLDRWKRWVRQMHNHILFDHDNIPVMSKAGYEGGYWVAESEAEAQEFHDTFIKRGKTALKKATRGKRTATVDLLEQIVFEFDGMEDETVPTPQIRPRAGRPMPIEIVDTFLERMTSNPEKFADGLRKIGDKYGSVLLPKERLHMIESRASELMALVGELNK